MAPGVVFLVCDMPSQSHIQFYQYLKGCWGYQDHKVSITKYCQGRQLKSVAPKAVVLECKMLSQFSVQSSIINISKTVLESP